MVSYEHKVKNIYLGADTLPSWYQEVEYIESTGTQYIDTWYKHNSNTQVDIKIAFNSLTWQRNTYYWGRTAYNNADAMSLNTNYTNYFSINIWWLTSDTIHTFNINTDYEISATKTYFKVNWTNYNISTNLSTCQYTDYLLALHEANTITPVNWTAKLYYCKISENWVLVRDFIPCYRTADDVIWLYDKVNDVFYTNSWTWTFTKWPDV